MKWFEDTHIEQEKKKNCIIVNEVQSVLRKRLLHGLRCKIRNLFLTNMLELIDQ